MRIPVALIGSFLVAGAPLTVSAQLHFCAGKPCPQTDEASSAGEEGHPQRAVLIDAVVLTPGLEKLNARAGIQRAVAASVAEKGWDAVVGASDCKDLVCAGAAAAAAKTPYAIVLTGRFVKDETYADDVAVSLLRDGQVVATQTEVEEEMDFVRKGGSRATFPRCGPPSGVCTTKMLAAKLPNYAAKLVANENVSIRIRKKVADAAGPSRSGEPASPVAVATKPVVLPSGPSVPPAPPESSHRWFGWTLVGVGAVAGVGSLVAWSKNNELNDCGGAGTGDPATCRRKRDTVVPALTLSVLAAGALGAGAFVLLRGRSDHAEVAVAVHPSGVAIGGQF